MKSLKLLVLTFAMGTACSVTVQAQDQTTPPSEGRRGRDGQSQGRGAMMSPEARVEQLDKAVTLTEEQKTKVKAIYAKAADDMRNTMREAKDDREGARTKMMDMMRKTREEVRALLTDEQKKKFDDMPQRGGPEAGARGRGKRGENKE